MKRRRIFSLVEVILGSWLVP
ncbi:MAG: hypothetical protein ACAI44_17720 [Candidatus Sericytochromatia bacterium]